MYKTMDPEVVIKVFPYLLHGIMVFSLYFKRMSRMLQILQKWLTILVELESVFKESPAGISNLRKCAEKVEYSSKLIWICHLIMQFFENGMSRGEKNVEIKLLGQWISR